MIRTWTETHISQPNGHQVDEGKHLAATRSIRKTTSGHQVDVGEHLAATRLMLGNTWWPLDGWKSARFNQTPTKSKANALKVKCTSKIQVIGKK